MKKKTIIIVSIIVLITVAIALVVVLRKPGKDEPTTDPEEATINRGNEQSTNYTSPEAIRASKLYADYYTNKSKADAAVIAEAENFFKDDVKGVTRVLKRLNKVTLLALRDRLCNEPLGICSLEEFLKGFYSDSQYNDLILLLNKIRKKNP